MRQLQRRELLLLAGIAILCGAFAAMVARNSGLLKSESLPVPASVPEGDWEVAWINTPTAADAWDEFVTGVKRIEMTSPGVAVDTSDAFPEQTTSVPQVVVSRSGHAGKIRFRWYKTGTGASTADWLTSLSRRDPAPLAVIGGWSSDRAIELADLLEQQTDWHGDRPLLFLTAATIDRVDADRNLQLTDLYPKRMFRYCFTNQQMADAVTDYLAQDSTLWPSTGLEHGAEKRSAAAVAGWPATLGAQTTLAASPFVFAVEWEDDPFSKDLAGYFQQALSHRIKPGLLRLNPGIVADPFRVPFSTGSFLLPNSGESEVIAEISQRLRPGVSRSVVVIPTVTGPMRRFLLALSERTPDAGRRLVAVTGDGLSLNTLYRDVDYVWPVRSISIPLVMFSHDNPVGWDTSIGPAPPSGYELEAASKRGTQDILLYRDMGMTLIEGLLPERGAGVSRADELAAHLHDLQPAVFHANGNRVGGSGEYVMVMRPANRTAGSPMASEPDAIIEVFRHDKVGGWTRVKSVEVRTDAAQERRAPS